MDNQNSEKFTPAAYRLPDPGETRDARFDANEHTIWIDSSEGEDEENLEDERQQNNFLAPNNCPTEQEVFRPAVCRLPDPGETRDSRFDANEHTIWIDSSDEDEEENLEQKRQQNNLFLAPNNSPTYQEVFRPAVCRLPDPGETRDSRFDANEHTIWIDSSDEDEENLEEERQQNNFLSASNDHDYNPWAREGPFPICHGLSDEGNCLLVTMPEFHEHLMEKMDFLPRPMELRAAIDAQAWEAIQNVQIEIVVESKEDDEVAKDEDQIPAKRRK